MTSLLDGEVIFTLRTACLTKRTAPIDSFGRIETLEVRDGQPLFDPGLKLSV